MHKPQFINKNTALGIGLTYCKEAVIQSSVRQFMQYGHTIFSVFTALIAFQTFKTHLARIYYAAFSEQIMSYPCVLYCISITITIIEKHSYQWAYRIRFSYQNT